MNLSILYRINRLERWFKELYCEFKNNTGSGDGSGPIVITTSEPSYDLAAESSTTILTFTGNDSQLNLPSLSSTKGLIVILTNAGTQSITITSPDGVWEGGMQMESTTMDIGSTARIVNDGVAYRINS